MVVHIFDIQFQFFLHYHVDVVFFGVFSGGHQLVLVTEFDACGVGDSGTHAQHNHLFLSPIVHVVPHFGTRPDKTHVAFQHVDKLGQFVEFQLADYVAAAGDTRVAAADGYKAAFVAAHTHGAEFEDAEIAVVAAYTHLSVKHRPAAVELYPNRHHKEQRRKHHQPQNAEKYVEQTLC